MPLSLDKRGKLTLSETQVQRQCIEYLRAQGWIVRPAPRNGTKAIRGAFSVPAGEPDLICVKRGNPPRVEFVECKSTTGKLSFSQIGWAYGAGFGVHVVRSLDELKRVL